MRVSLFVTCIVDQVYPHVGEAAFKLLTRLGVKVVFNAEQTCCGQPAYNAGYRREAKAVAARTLELLEKELLTSDYVVAPSGSCAAMTRKSYQELFADDPNMRQRAAQVGERFYELTQFLVEVLKTEDTGASFEGAITYHDSCHLLRELGVAEAPRKLIRAVQGARLVEMKGSDVCCGFGGTFSVKFPEISSAMASDKAANIEKSGAQAVVMCDASCMMQTAEMLKRRGSSARCLHIAELLAAGDVQ